MTETSERPIKKRTLNETVVLFDDDGNHYYRKIGTGIKRGELILERAKNGEPVAYLKAKPTGLNLTNMRTGKPVRHELGDTKDLRLMFPLTEEAFAKACELYGAPLRMTTKYVNNANNDDTWCGGCVECHELDWAHLKGHDLNCQCSPCFVAWAPQIPPTGRNP
jgi:hypothetical protein